MSTFPPRFQNQRPIEYAVAILRDCALTHADLKTLIGLLASEVGALDRSGEYEGYSAVSEHLDNALVALDECYAAGVDLDDAARSESAAEWRAEARAFNRGQA